MLIRQRVVAWPADQVVDAVGQDAVPNPGAGSDRLLQIAIRLRDVVGRDGAGAQDVPFELNARVVDVQAHPAGVADTRRHFARHFGQRGDGGRFNETLESGSDVVFGRPAIAAFNDEAENSSSLLAFMVIPDDFQPSPRRA